MKLVHHIKIANQLLDKLDNKLKEKVVLNKAAFYLGSILPDINCIYPAHRLGTTKNRVVKAVESISTLKDSDFIKSMQLGIITHYVCDYFCYAHSNETIGVIHKAYEKRLYDYYEIHKNTFLDENNLVVEWDKALEIIQKKLFDRTDTMTAKSHAYMVLDQIEVLNKEYMIKSKGLRRDKSWVTDIEQCKRDLEYSVFMCENILAMILEPIRCVSVNYK